MPLLSTARCLFSQPLDAPALPCPQNVTLGGTGKETGDRHPKVCENVLIGASATILGNIKVRGRAGA